MQICSSLSFIFQLLRALSRRVRRNLLSMCPCWRSWFRFVKDKAVDGLVGRHAKTVICELELPLAKHFADCHLVNSSIKFLVCCMVSRLFDTQNNPLLCLAKMSSFLVNASVSVHVSQPHNNVETHAALIRRILNIQ